jgi:hypothetical protein
MRKKEKLTKKLQKEEKENAYLIALRYSNQTNKSVTKDKECDSQHNKIK